MEKSMRSLTRAPRGKKSEPRNVITHEKYGAVEEGLGTGRQ